MIKYYEEEKARALVIKAGHELINKKLIARTWGNISARISETQFVITPSGRSYEDLSEDELVIVNIADASYDGDIKPSSEKKLHAVCYALREDCAFIVHTHQFYASAICAEEKSTSFAPCAKYALSGTKALSKNVASVVNDNPESNSFLMSKHGAICLGVSYEEAFDNAEKLEAQCKELFDKEASDSGNYNVPWLDDYAQMFSKANVPNDGEDEEAVRLVREKNEAAARYVKSAKPVSRAIAKLEHTVYTLKYSKQKDNK